MTAADRPPMSRRERLMWVYRIAGPAGALALAATLLLLRSPHRAPGADPARFVVMLALIVVIMGWTLAFAWLTARKEDEYTLTGSKFAWFWGGIIGLGCSLPVAAFAIWGGLTTIDPVAFPASRERAFGLWFGYMLAVVFQFVGFLIARVWWGVRRS
jgi:hypothetical protein